MTRSIFSHRRCLASVVVAALVLTGLFAIGRADPLGPTSRDQHIAGLVAQYLRKEHLTKHPLDDEIAQRTVVQFVKMLDPMKVYFYQSDVDTFTARSREVENAKKGDISFGYVMFKTFLARLDERVKLVDELLAAKHDFTVDEEILVDRDEAKFPKTPDEAKERWRKRIKYDLLVLKADQLEKDKKVTKDKKDKKEGAKSQSDEGSEEKLTPAQEAKEGVDRLARRYRNFAKRMHQTSSDELLEMYLTSISSSFDPHTSYMSPESMENFEIQMRLNLEGIGAALRSDDGFTMVDRLIPGGPAEKDGRLKVKDKIVGVGQGHDGKIEDVVDMKLNDVVTKIRGKAGTIVRLQLEHGRSHDRRTIELTRAAVELKDSEARSKIFNAGAKPDGSPYKIGVIDLPSFYMDMQGARMGKVNFRSTTRDVSRILDEFNRQGVDSLILDLRRNGGGSLQEAINLTGLFVDKGPVVQVKDADGNIHPYSDNGAGMAWKGPMIVLISKFSASASEILAGAIQDYDRGLIVGDHSTHGKGTVQSLMDLGETFFGLHSNSPKYGALKITMQQFFRPDGDSTQKRGVLADLELPSITTHLEKISESDLDYALEFDQVPAQEFHKFSFVTKPIIEKLKALSAQRVAASSDFQKVRKDIARYEEQRKRKYVTLNEKKFLAERAEMNADGEEEKEFAEMNDPNNTEIKRNYYLDEAMAICVDYLRLPAAPPAAQAVQNQRRAQDD